MYLAFIVINHHDSEKLSINEWLICYNLKRKIKSEVAHLQSLIKEVYVMKLLIGENIKSLRKLKDITQEQLAEMLNVSCQSVSRWELGVCYPDMELLPVMAQIFETTVDKLLGVDDITESKKVDEYLSRFQQAISKGKIDECISIARIGVNEYPNNYALLNKLMYALFISGDETGNIDNWKENMEKYDAEITSLGERIMKYCPNQNIRLEAMARLAFNHCEQGRKEKGREIYEKLPPMILCRENQMWEALKEDEKLPFLQKQIKKSYDMLSNFIWLLATCEKLTPKESISVIEKLGELDNLITDGNYNVISTYGNSQINYEKAKLYAKIGDEKSVYKHLESAAKRAIDFDGRPEIDEYNSLLLGNVKVKQTDFETADTRPLTEIMRNSWLSDTAFDSIRNTPEFEKIESML